MNLLFFLEDVVIFNVTSEKTAIPAHCNLNELYRSQQYATAVYRTELRCV